MRTMDGQIMGTPAFMAPEQALGKIDAIDGRTDTYSLGAILYNILALRPPIEGRNVNEVLLKVSRGNITPPVDLESSSPGARGSAEHPAAKRRAKGQLGIEFSGTSSACDFFHTVEYRKCARVFKAFRARPRSAERSFTARARVFP